MFSIFARNAQALGMAATHAVPVVNPVPPPDTATAVFYAHHPPGLPWLVMLADRVVQPVEFAGRLIALLATLASALLLADIGTRLSGRDAGFAAGVLALSLPAGLHHGLLVNYETVAIPGLLLLVRSLALGVGRPWLAGLGAAFADWISLLPLLLSLRSRPGRRWLGAAIAAGLLTVVTMVLSRTAAPASTSETLAQAVGTSFLAPDFTWSAWADAMGAHLPALFGWSLLTAALATCVIPLRSPRLRRVLVWLLVTGVINVVLFGRHATGHEHFSLLLLPFVALGTATLVFPCAELPSGRTRAGVLALAVLLALGWWQFREAEPGRTQTHQAALADAFREVAAEGDVHARPGGASFVFLHRAARHVLPGPVGGVDGARAALAAYRDRFGLAGAPGHVALAPDDAVPAWLAALGPPVERNGWRFFALLAGD